MRSFRFICVSIVSGLLIASCGNQKRLPNSYLENVGDTVGKDAVKIPDPTIQKNDLLSIMVYSATTVPEIDAPYNLPNLGGTTTTGTTVSGYLVDSKGNIEYPRIGTIHVEGLTKSELGDLIKKRINEPVKQLENPSVIVRFLNYKITVLGEVARAGSYSLPAERVTVLEALGLAGDITVYGKRNNVKVIREINGTREIGTIDLTSKDLFESPYYYLVQNDLVLVEAKKTKAKQADDAATTQRISFALSIITSIALLYNIFR
jgi:polysaccharide export outer membrane protein